MIVIFTGAPGAGKGTQADLVQERLGFRKVSTGDALRRQVKLGTEIGKVAEEVMTSGNLVSDEILLKILKAEVGTDSSERILLDGYPRNLSQVSDLNELKDDHPVKAVLHIDVDHADIKERITGRRNCPQCGSIYHVTLNAPKVENVCDQCGHKGLAQRKDDTEVAVEARLRVFDAETKPIIEHYQQSKQYVRIPGSGNVEQIYKRIAEELKKIS